MSTNKIRSIAFSQDGKYLASSTDDKKIVLWSMESQKEINTLKVESENVNYIAFSPDGKYLASFYYREITFWSVLSQKIFSEIKSQKRSLSCM